MKTKIILILFILISFKSAVYSQARGDYAKWNPSYHYYPSGDPTGLFYYNGLYYNQWGAALSKDLVHWEFTEQGRRSTRNRQSQQDPNFTDAQRDSLRRTQVRLGGSGSIVVDWKNTGGFGDGKTPPLLSFFHNGVQPWSTQVVGMAYSNDLATTWTRWENNPILDINSREFRDPKVFWHEPTQKWVLAIGWAEIPKIMFFNSDNLIEWTFQSEFGPWGATNGVWECVDLFPLMVDGNPQNEKWALIISVQPFKGQYFIGSFDGKRFVMDEDFVQQLSAEKYKPQGDLLFDFENGIDDWQLEGDAFLQSPTSMALYRQGAVMAKEGNFFINSTHNQAGGTGKITSPEFIINKNYLNFKIGGGYFPGKTAVNLLVNGKIVRTETGKNANNLQWAGWDVSEFRGKTVRLEVVDEMSTGFGCIYLDHVMLCDEPAVNEPENAFWADFGADFFAVRAWNNYAENENRVIWTAWMGSWRYADVDPVRGIQTVPREVKLKTFPEGIRLIQLPIDELKSLRNAKQTTSVTGEIFEGIWSHKKIKPSKNCYELIVEIENIDAKEFGLKVCVGNEEKTTIGYNIVEESFYVDRRDSGFDSFSGLFPEVNKGFLKNRNNQLKLHLFVDNCSVEVFGNDGEAVISTKIYPDPSSLGIEFFSNNGKINVKTIDLYELNPINLHN